MSCRASTGCNWPEVSQCFFSPSPSETRPKITEKNLVHGSWLYSHRKMLSDHFSFTFMLFGFCVAETNQVGCTIPDILVNNSVCNCPWTCADEAPQQVSSFDGQVYPVNCDLVIG